MLIQLVLNALFATLIGSLPVQFGLRSRFVENSWGILLYEVLFAA